MVGALIDPKGSRPTGGVKSGEVDILDKEGYLVRFYLEGGEITRRKSDQPRGGQLEDTDDGEDILRKFTTGKGEAETLVEHLEAGKAELMRFELEPVFDGGDQCIHYSWNKYGGSQPPGQHVVIHYGPEGTKWKPTQVLQSDKGLGHQTWIYEYDPACVPYICSQGKMQRLTVDPDSKELIDGGVIGQTDIQLADSPIIPGRPPPPMEVG